MWLGKASVTFSIKLTASAVRGGAELQSGLMPHMLWLFFPWLTRGISLWFFPTKASSYHFIHESSSLNGMNCPRLSQRETRVKSSWSIHLLGGWLLRNEVERTCSTIHMSTSYNARLDRANKFPPDVRYSLRQGDEVTRENFWDLGKESSGWHTGLGRKYCPTGTCCDLYNFKSTLLQCIQYSKTWVMIKAVTVKKLKKRHRPDKYATRFQYAIRFLYHNEWKLDVFYHSDWK